MPAFPSQPSTAGRFKHILETYGLNISLSHAMSQTLHQEVILMLMQILISTPKKWKVQNQFLQFKTAPVVEIETKPMKCINNHELTMSHQQDKQHWKKPIAGQLPSEMGVQPQGNYNYKQAVQEKSWMKTHGKPFRSYC